MGKSTLPETFLNFSVDLPIHLVAHMWHEMKPTRRYDSVIRFRLPRKLKKRLATQVRRRGMLSSEAARAAIVAWVEREEGKV